jgi:hypothetical protein
MICGISCAIGGVCCKSIHWFLFQEDPIQEGASNLQTPNLPFWLLVQKCSHATGRATYTTHSLLCESNAAQTHTQSSCIVWVCLCASLFCALREDHLDKVQWALFERCLSNADARMYMHAEGTICVRLQPPPEALLGGCAAADRRPCNGRPTQTSVARARSELTLLRPNNLPPTLFGPFPSACDAFCLERVCIAEWERQQTTFQISLPSYYKSDEKGRNGSFEVPSCTYS